MVNRVEKGLAFWEKVAERHAGIFGPESIHRRGFAKLTLKEMTALYKRCQPPRNMEERLSLMEIRAGNKDLERQLYPNRIYRVGRRFARWTFRQAGRVVKGIAAMMQDNPAAHLNAPAPRKKEPAKVTPAKVVMHPAVKRTQQVQRPRVARLQPKVHPPLPLATRKKGISK